MPLFVINRTTDSTDFVKLLVVNSCCFIWWKNKEEGTLFFLSLIAQLKSGQNKMYPLLSLPYILWTPIISHTTEKPHENRKNQSCKTNKN